MSALAFLDTSYAVPDPTESMTDEELAKLYDEQEAHYLKVAKEWRALHKGDVLGHEFHGNQWTGGQGGGFQSTTPESFIRARDASTRGGYLSPLAPADLDGYVLATTPDGKVGYAVDPHGDIQNVFNNGGPKGSGAVAVAEAIERHGGRTLDCFNGYLPKLYTQLGFVETGRMKFSDEHAPPNWNFARDGRPDVVFMAWQGFGPGGKEAALARATGDKNQWAPHVAGTHYDDDYERAKEDARGAVHPDGHRSRLAASVDGPGRGNDPEPGEGLRGPLRKGDLPGHEFHGNQHTGGIGGDPASPTAPWRTPEETFTSRPTGADPTQEEQRAAYDRKDAWEQSALAAASLGLVTSEDAKREDISRVLDRRGAGSDKAWVDLPPVLYHVTTAAEDVERDGLKSRFELSQGSGHGLGGGDDKSISFTTDPKVADDILHALKEGHDVAAGNVDIRSMLDDAAKGWGAKRPFIEGVVRNYGNNEWKKGDPLPRELDAYVRGKMPSFSASFGDPPREPGDWTPSPQDEGWKNGKGETLHSRWERSMTPDEARQARFQVYQAFAFMREHAGGRMDPLFFTSDSKALAGKDPGVDFKVLKYEPAPGARGTRESALGEIRTYTGRAVRRKK